MLSTRSATEDPISLRPSTTIAAKLLPISALAAIAFCLSAIPVYAQGSLSLGTLTNVSNPSSCNSGSGFYYYVYPSTGLALDMNCLTATVSNCNNNNVTTDPWGVTIGYLNPVGVVSGVSVAKGLIVLHGGDGGTMPESFALTDAYFRAGYEVVQVAWADAWEMISDPLIGTPKLGNIQAAACRPATVFNWVYTNLFTSVLNANSRAGMCALGDSAGSAAVAYSLAYYNAGSYLDNVELLSGPVLSDIEQGCGVGMGLGSANPVTVCSPTSKNQGWGCQLGGGPTWTLGPEYVAGAQTAVQGWTNETSSCAVSNPTNSQSNSDWLRESIVDQPSVSGGPTPTFTYSNTSMSAWLCRSVVDHNNYDCTANNNNNSNSCPNNSSPQGQLFYQNIPYGTLNFSVYAVDHCQNAEAVGSGNVPGFYPQDFGGTITGLNAITYDMIGYTSATVVIPVHVCAGTNGPGVNVSRRQRLNTGPLPLPMSEAVHTGQRAEPPKKGFAS